MSKMPLSVHRMATAATTAAMLLGGATAFAPAASAVDSDSCTANEKVKDTWTVEVVNFRTGPGTGYTSRGLLQERVDVYAACTAKGGTWTYIRVEEGPHKNTKGWVAAHLLALPTQF